ncbi:MAG TPA: hypothetical protein VF502_15890 [Stellaceae bacterium]
MELLIPSWADLAGWAGVLVASLALMGFGRLLSLGRAAPEAALVAGWGGACFVLTIWGVTTTASLWLPAIGVTVVGLLGVAAVPPRPGTWGGLLRMAALALPLLVVMASARPSLPDTFLNLLPNAAYLYDHAGFPADDRWPSYSFLPGAPYNLQLAAFIASLFAPEFPPNAMIALNIVLQLAFALFLTRLLERSEEDAATVPSWGATALGLLLTTALNPGFVPRYHLSAYSEASVTVTLGFAAWFAARALERLAAGRPARTDLTLVALTLAALVNIKQDSIAIVVGLVAAAVALALLAGGERRGRAAAALALAALPALLLYLAWRWYVLTHFAGGELKPLPFAQWQFGNIPLILRSMAGEMAERAYFLVAVALALAGLVWRVRRRGLDLTTRVAALFAGVTLVYNAALLVTYIGHFPGRMSVEAHSYFRYNTHLGLLLVLTLVLLARDIAAERSWALAGAARRAAPAILMTLVALCPLVFFGYLRFDLEAPQQRAWQIAAMAIARLGEEKRLALLLPGDNGSLTAMLDGLIRFTSPHHRDVDLRIVTMLAPDTLDRLAADGYGLAFVSCVPAGFADLPAGRPALLERDAGGWRSAELEPYPAPRSRHWSHVLTEASLCL